MDSSPESDLLAQKTGVHIGKVEALLVGPVLRLDQRPLAIPGSDVVGFISFCFRICLLSQANSLCLALFSYEVLLAVRPFLRFLPGLVFAQGLTFRVELAEGARRWGVGSKATFLAAIEKGEWSWAVTFAFVGTSTPYLGNRILQREPLVWRRRGRIGHFGNSQA